MKFLRRFDNHERDAAIVLVLVVVVSIVLFPYLSEQDNGGSKSSRGSRSLNSSRSSRGSWEQKFQGENNSCSASVASRPVTSFLTLNSSLFNFDPNTASEQQLLSLGLSQRHVRNIMKYRSHGGRFRKKEDFARLYGLTLKQYRQLEPYITIQPEVMAADVIKGGQNNRNNQNTQKKDSSLFTLNSSLPKLRFGETVDINTADTAELKKIPGIGSYYAKRIVELRQRKQAFVSPEELLTIRNFPETALTYMTASQNFPEIFVNQWSQKQLADHPLLNYAQARDIIALRRTAGMVKAASDLAALPSLDAATLKRVTPFLRFETRE